MTNYAYTEQVEHEIERMARDAIPFRIMLTKATRQQDFGGIDVIYRVSAQCDLQIRCRFNRPAYAQDCDITFRTTEPAMIRARTYAPLMLFLWFKDGYAIHGKLIDIYRMDDKIYPPLRERGKNPNHDDTAFHTVDIGELHNALALLRVGDRDGWATCCNGGKERIRHLLNEPPQPITLPKLPAGFPGAATNGRP